MTGTHLRSLALLLLVSCAAGCDESPRRSDADGGISAVDSGPAVPLPACGPATCDGCCLDDYRCMRGTAQQTCGAGGEACTACSAPDSCIGGVCQAGPIETCNDQDDDGDGDVDEGCDDDGDQVCDASMEVAGTPAVCAKGTGDCDDERGRVNSDATEICNGLDDNCDGQIDEGGVCDATNGQLAPTRPAHLPAVVSNHACVAAAGKVFCLGGRTHLVSVSNRIVSFDPDSNQVDVRSAHLPIQRYDLSCTASDAGGREKIYCFGGYLHRQACPDGEPNCSAKEAQAFLLDDVFTFDPVDETVEPRRATLPAAVRGLSCVAHASSASIVCFGGKTSTGESAQIVTYDPAGDQMRTRAAALPQPAAYLSCSAAGDAIYCFGGEQGDDVLDTIVKYSPGSDTVETLGTALPTPASRLACVAGGDQQHIYCVGGRAKVGQPPLVYDDALAEIVGFDAASAQASPMSLALPEARDGHACALHAASNTIFCLGGARYDISFDDVVAITP